MYQTEVSEFTLAIVIDNNDRHRTGMNLRKYIVNKMSDYVTFNA